MHVYVQKKDIFVYIKKTFFFFKESYLYVNHKTHLETYLIPQNTTTVYYCALLSADLS